MLPVQNDLVTIPIDPLGMQSAPGDFLITSAWDNGGGELSLHLKEQDMITETQTSAYDIRDAFYNVVTAAPFFAGFTCRKNKMLPVQRNLIPYLGVYLVDEMMTPDGDANAGCIRFTHNVRIGFSMIQVNNDPNAAEQAADQAMQAIMVIGLHRFAFDECAAQQQSRGRRHRGDHARHAAADLWRAVD